MEASGCLLVFAGAGASKAVNPSRYPTTVEFYEQLPDKVKSDPRFAAAHNFLASQAKKAQEPIDIEAVLWSLRDFRRFAAIMTSNATLPGFLWANNQFFKLADHSNNTATPPLAKLASRLVESIDALVDQINREVYRHYGTEPDRGELEDNWLTLLREVAQLKLPRVDFFTTNYDLVIEEAVRFHADECGEPLVDAGRRPSGQRNFLDADLWLNTFINDEEQGLVTKLHGSSDWARTGLADTRIYTGSPGFMGDHGKHVIIYPGFKGAPADEPFSRFHDHFERALASCGRVLFIGFAFRDEYINDVIRRSLRRDAQVVLIDPRKDPKDIPIPSGQLTHLDSDAGFCSSTILQALRVLK